MPRNLVRLLLPATLLGTGFASTAAQAPLAEFERLGMVADLVSIEARPGSRVSLGALARLADLPPPAASTGAVPIRLAGNLILPLAELQGLVEELARRGRPALLDARFEGAASLENANASSMHGLRVLEDGNELPLLHRQPDTARFLLLQHRSARDLARDLELLFDPLTTGLRCTPRSDMGAVLLEGPPSVLDAVMPLARHLDLRPDAERHRLHPIDLTIDGELVRVHGSRPDDLDFKALAELAGRVLGRDIGFDGVHGSPRAQVVGSVEAPRERTLVLLRILGLAAGHDAVVHGITGDAPIEFWDLNRPTDSPRFVHPRTLLEGQPTDDRPVITWWFRDPGLEELAALRGWPTLDEIELRKLGAEVVVLTGSASTVRDAIRRLVR